MRLSLSSQNLEMSLVTLQQTNVSCSKQNFSKALITLGAKDLQEIIEEDHKIEAVCHYCGEKYLFNEEELKIILEKII